MPSRTAARSAGDAIAVDRLNRCFRFQCGNHVLTTTQTQCPVKTRNMNTQACANIYSTKERNSCGVDHDSGIKRWRTFANNGKIRATKPFHFQLRLATMVLKLYAFNMSICGRRVATVLVEKKVPFKLLPAENIKGEAWLEHHPVSPCVRRSNSRLIFHLSSSVRCPILMYAHSPIKRKDGCGARKLTKPL